MLEKRTNMKQNMLEKRTKNRQKTLEKRTKVLKRYCDITKNMI